MEPTFPVDNRYKTHGTNANSWHTKVPQCSSYVPYRCKQRKSQIITTTLQQIRCWTRKFYIYLGHLYSPHMTRQIMDSSPLCWFRNTNINSLPVAIAFSLNLMWFHCSIVTATIIMIIITANLFLVISCHYFGNLWQYFRRFQLWFLIFFVYCTLYLKFGCSIRITPGTSKGPEI